MSTFRLLVTGSRDWPDPVWVWRAIDQIWCDHGTGREFVVVHGACPTGADLHASQWAEANRDIAGVEGHPADWETHGRAAGPIRNQLMVDLGADLCLAFPLGASRGTRDCMRRAETAGIAVIEVSHG